MRAVEVVSASRARPDGLASGVSHETVDLLDSQATVDLVERVRPTHLLHLAWYVTPGKFWNAPENLDWAAASLTLLRAFLSVGGQRAVMAGTCAEYDWAGASRLTESGPIKPGNLYGAAKDAVRRCACAAADHLGGSVAWGRVFWLYGPGEAQGRLVSDVASALIAGRVAKVGDGRRELDFLHVDDVAGAFVAALGGDWRGPFNVGSGRPISVRQLVDMVGVASGRPDLVEFGTRPASAGEPPRLYADTSILHEHFGFTPKITLEDGIAEMLRVMRAGGH
jgi:nucleoside-diphosphate-sugar epimerase